MILDKFNAYFYVNEVKGTARIYVEVYEDLHVKTLKSSHQYKPTIIPERIVGVTMSNLNGVFIKLSVNGNEGKIETIYHNDVIKKGIYSSGEINLVF